MLGNAGGKALRGVADDSGQTRLRSIAEDNAQCSRDETPAVALEVGQERTHTLRNHAGCVDEILAGRVQMRDGSRS